VSDEEPLAALADGWIAATIRSNPENGGLKAVPRSARSQLNEPVQAFIELRISNPDDAFQVVEHVLGKTSDPWVLANLGAGPLEDLLETGDASAIARVNTLAEKYPNAREALSHVWTSHFPPQSRDAVARILSSSGAPALGSRNRT
jgi:hypothetical protein